MVAEMGYRYSNEEIGQVESLVSQRLTSREIAARLNRSEPGIRNIRYRRKLTTRTEENIKSLQASRKEAEAKIDELIGEIKIRSNELKSLEEKKKQYEETLFSDEESIRKKIEDRLDHLKLEKPELFYITDAEQIAKLGALIVKWIFS
ncbi:hypothetical protein MUP59_08450 [Candidatus Bathyarchaeota archaeon]|nr:hypothetical protein [Candidatus Bathyarchaeota archaeon]